LQEISQILASNLTEEDISKVEEEYEQLVGEISGLKELPAVPSDDPTLSEEIEEEKVRGPSVAKKQKEKARKKAQPLLAS